MVWYPVHSDQIKVLNILSPEAGLLLCAGKHWAFLFWFFIKKYIYMTVVSCSHSTVLRKITFSPSSDSILPSLATTWPFLITNVHCFTLYVHKTSCSSFPIWVRACGTSLCECLTLNTPVPPTLHQWQLFFSWLKYSTRWIDRQTDKIDRDSR